MTDEQRGFKIDKKFLKKNGRLNLDKSVKQLKLSELRDYFDVLHLRVRLHHSCNDLRRLCIVLQDILREGNID